MATLKDYRDERLRKLSELKKLGINPYPARAERTHTIKQIIDDFDVLENKPVSIVGRVKSLRKFGKIAFIVIADQTDKVQLFWKENKSETDRKSSEINLSDINLLDTGDFVECSGPVIKTQTGELSVEVKKLRLLTKSLRPMPNDQQGFTNKEERLRRRYIDTNVNADIRQRFVRRSKFWQATRDFLLQEGFLEVNIPVLEHTTGGADANPFVTHMDALDQDFYLRISHELPLKRLLGGGYEKVFDIGPRFRNENYSDEHLPEHIAMEWYAAYWDWRQGMEFMTKMYRYVLQETFGTLKFDIGNFEIDLSKDWQELDYAKTIKKHYKLNVFDCTLNQIKTALKENNLEVEQTENIARGIDKLWKNIRKDIAGPVWLINTPLFVSPLAKVDPDKPNTVQRFQPVIAGSELGNGFSELNDPIEQLQRFLEQQNMRDAGDDEAMMLDIDYVEMLEYGMPPACGWGFSERVFWIFEKVTAREGVIFPHLRKEIDETTKAIYPELSNNKPKSIARHQDFSKKIIAVVNGDLEPWQVANAVAHMTIIIGNITDKTQLTSGDLFLDKQGLGIPRNTQYPIIVMKSNDKELHKLHTKVIDHHLKYHVFVKEMIDTTNDKEIETSLKNKDLADVNFYGVCFIADNKTADTLTKNYQLWK